MDTGAQALNGLLATAVAFLFLYSGLAKLVALHAFERTLLAIPFFPPVFSKPSSVLVPLLEVVIAVLILAGTVLGLHLAIALLAVFSVAAALAISRKRTISCSCFGSDGDEVLSWGTIIRNTMIMIALVIAQTKWIHRPDFVTTANSAVAFVLYLVCSRTLRNRKHWAALTSKRRIS